MKKIIHQHLFLRARIQNPPLDRDVSNEWLSSMVRRIGMQIACSAKSAYVTDPGNVGMTGSINLSTSHIAYHVWDEDRLLMMDVYSCQCFNEKIIFDMIREFMGIEELWYNQVDRNDLSLYPSNFKR